MKRVVISGSGKLLDKIDYWCSFFEQHGCHVIGKPEALSESNFLQELSVVHSRFYQAIDACDILFVANEDKNGVSGYIGPSAFSEINYAIAQNLNHGKQILIFIRQMPDKNLPVYEEISSYLSLGWIYVWPDEPPKQFVRVLLKKGDEYLIIKEVKPNGYNFWNFPGGKIETDEIPEQAAIREIKEETNIVSQNMTLLGIYNCFYSIGLWKGYFFLCTDFDMSHFRISESTKCHGFAWLNIDEIRKIQPNGVFQEILDQLES